jgi:hypothetical protein
MTTEPNENVDNSTVKIDTDSKNDTKPDVKNVIERHDFLFKVILLGDTQTGKTNLLSR